MALAKEICEFCGKVIGPRAIAYIYDEKIACYRCRMAGDRTPTVQHALSKVSGVLSTQDIVKQCFLGEQLILRSLKSHKEIKVFRQNGDLIGWVANQGDGPPDGWAPGDWMATEMNTTIKRFIAIIVRKTGGTPDKPYNGLVIAIFIAKPEATQKEMLEYAHRIVFQETNGTINLKAAGP